MSVFQGTILGPTLFSCFINDLPNATDLLSILFAVETTGLDSDANIHTLTARVSSELSKMAIWFQSNKMSLNISKTKYIIFHAPGKKIPPGISLQIENTNIERIHSNHPNHSSPAFKLLGIYLDEHLNFNYNTSALTSKLSRAIFFFNRVKNTLSPKALKSLYISFFHSHLLYCLIIYTSTSQSNITAIFKQQKKLYVSYLGQNTQHTPTHSSKLSGYYPLKK